MLNAYPRLSGPWALVDSSLLGPWALVNSEKKNYCESNNISYHVRFFYKSMIQKPGISTTLKSVFFQFTQMTSQMGGFFLLGFFFFFFWSLFHFCFLRVYELLLLTLINGSHRAFIVIANQRIPRVLFPFSQWHRIWVFCLLIHHPWSIIQMIQRFLMYYCTEEKTPNSYADFPKYWTHLPLNQRPPYWSLTRQTRVAPKHRNFESIYKSP
jgi:hypothetical protein